MQQNKLRVFKFSQLAALSSSLKDRHFEDVAIFLNADEDGIKFAGSHDMMKVFDKCMISIKEVRGSIDLDIRDNYLDDKKLAGIIKFIEFNPLVQKLNLNFPSNFITDKGFKTMISAIGENCKELRSLGINVDWYSNNNLGILISKTAVSSIYQK
jgi:hypothetical protein